MAFPINAWIKALRLRTLPLALAVTGMGNLLVFRSTGFQWPILAFSVLTTLLLQILSNLANDYGDSIHGADNTSRKGPGRAVQSGLISPRAMFNGIVSFGLLSLLSGLWLLWISFHTDWVALLPLFAIGLLAIAAAYFYTNGSKPYGYQALGDVSVFIFFGLVGVMATSYLHTRIVDPWFLLPACAMGFWSTAVLNVNNMRDMDSDREAGKETIPLKLGLAAARRYHIFLVSGGSLCLLVFVLATRQWALLGFLPGGLLVLKSLSGVLNTTELEKLDPFLKPQAVGTFVAVLGMWISVLVFATL